MGLPAAMAVDIVTNLTSLEDTNATQEIMSNAGIGTYLGIGAVSLAAGVAAMPSSTLNGGFVIKVSSGALLSSGMEYATQVYGNLANGLSGQAAWIDAVDGREVAWWALPGAMAGWGLVTKPYAALLYGGTNTAGYGFYATFTGFAWDDFRIALATGLFGGGIAPWMATTPWGAGIHGGLLNLTQYGLQQSLDCQHLEWLNSILALGTGFAVGYAGGAYAPAKNSYNVTANLPLPYDQSIAAEITRRRVLQVLREQFADNARLTFVSSIRGTMGATVTNSDLSPISDRLQNLSERDKHDQ
jgi:hypothetical protein